MLVTIPIVSSGHAEYKYQPFLIVGRYDNLTVDYIVNLQHLIHNDMKIKSNGDSRLYMYLDGNGIYRDCRIDVYIQECFGWIFIRNGYVFLIGYAERIIVR